MAANPFEPVARFHGNLDITALGGAGFASQRTAAEERTWDLHDYDGIDLELVTDGADSTRYTLTLKDTLPPPGPRTGRDQSTVSFEHDFTVPPHPSKDATTSTSTSSKPSTYPTTTTTLRIPFADFKPIYRGRAVPDAGPLDRRGIRRLSLLVRSFFGAQSGPFSLRIRSVAAYRTGTESETGTAWPALGGNKTLKRLLLCAVILLAVAETCRALGYMEKAWELLSIKTFAG